MVQILLALPASTAKLLRHTLLRSSACVHLALLLSSSLWVVERPHQSVRSLGTPRTLFASKMGKAIIILPPSASGPDGDKKPCATCHRLRGANLFGRDSPDVCNACNLVNRRMTQSAHHERISGSEIRGKAGYSKHGKHQENFSATKYIKP